MSAAGRMGLVLLVALTAGRAAGEQVWRMRAVAKLSGVYSPRGFFNIVVRLECLDGAEWVKLDLKRAQITVDFELGEEVSKEDLARVQHEAGYRPWPVELFRVSGETVDHSAPGWMPLKFRPAKRTAQRRRKPSRATVGCGPCRRTYWWS
jgi:hypothetical protein